MMVIRNSDTQDFSRVFFLWVFIRVKLSETVYFLDESKIFNFCVPSIFQDLMPDLSQTPHKFSIKVAYLYENLHLIFSSITWSVGLPTFERVGKIRQEKP